MDADRLSVVEGENRTLRAEVMELRTRCTVFDSQLAEFRAGLDALQAHAGLLENLFIASSRLHDSTDLAETLRTVSDIMRDLIGAKRFAVYLFDERNHLQPVLRDENSTTSPPADTPGLASVDLKLGARKVGVVTVFELLSQKAETLTSLDHELLGVVGRQAAPALLTARLLSEREQRAAVMSEFVRYLVDGAMEKAR